MARLPIASEQVIVEKVDGDRGVSTTDRTDSSAARPNRGMPLHVGVHATMAAHALEEIVGESIPLASNGVGKQRAEPGPGTIPSEHQMRQPIHGLVVSLRPAGNDPTLPELFGAGARFGGEVRMTRLSIQLIVFGSRASEDLPGVLGEVRAAGYDGAEIGEPTDTVEASTLRGWFDAAGLACSGYHAGYATFLDTDRLIRVAEHMRMVGARYLMCSGVSRRDHADGYRESAKVLDAAGKVLGDHGIRLCYHNHHWEYFDLGGGTRGMDILLEETTPEHVACCFDVYWLACAGIDPAATIARHADRLAVAHLKDGTFDPVAQRPDTFTELGNGAVPLMAAWDAIRRIGPEWATTEQDRTERTPAESAAISARYAREVLGIGR